MSEIKEFENPAQEVSDPSHRQTTSVSNNGDGLRSLYPDHANPLKLVSRIKKIQDDLSIVKDQCQELLFAKQDLIDKARTTLVGNRNLLQRIQASVAISTSDAEDPAYDSFKEVIEEWTAQVQSRAGKEAELSPSDDINKLLFSSKVGG